MSTPDYAWKVEITGDRSLNEDGWEKLEDAITEVDVEELIRVALGEALDKLLPWSVWDKARGEERFMEWYGLRVREVPTTGEEK